ncbi:hypothetical protein [Hydrogenophaga sp.]|uniref:hypothetical protein n=1 Tax=Hydrogenophaga sp. TaxID=1904254 RepID=UPI003F6D20AA
MIETGPELLRRRCAEFEISEQVEVKLSQQAKFIAEWRSSIYPNDLTPTRRAKALARIEAMAKKLAEEIEGLPFGDRLALDGAYFEPDRPAILDAVEAGAEPEQFDLGGFVLPRLQQAAAHVQKGIIGVGKAGAPPMTERQADFIRCIAQSLKPAGVAPSNSGRFRDLCDAVFLAGGMTLPDRALRLFMKEIRPWLKADGYCL